MPPRIFMNQTMAFDSYDWDRAMEMVERMLASYDLQDSLKEATSAR